MLELVFVMMARGRVAPVVRTAIGVTRGHDRHADRDRAGRKHCKNR